LNFNKKLNTENRIATQSKPSDALNYHQHHYQNKNDNQNNNFDIEFEFDNDENVDFAKNNANFNDNCDGSINNRRMLFEADWLKKVINNDFFASSNENDRKRER
jgi:hypothetical protein